eukprot:4487153-Prymnesium_polylepis.1
MCPSAVPDNIGTILRKKVFFNPRDFSKPLFVTLTLRFEIGRFLRVEHMAIGLNARKRRHLSLRDDEAERSAGVGAAQRTP